MKFRNLLFTLATVLIFTSCEKNDNSKSFRLLRAVREQGSSYYIDSLSYEGDKLSSIKYYQKDEDGAWYETSKTEISYDGDQVTSIDYTYETTGYVENMKSEYIVDDGLMLEERRFTYYNEAWIPTWKWTYQYSGNKLTAWNSYETDESNSYYIDGKCEYTYQNGLLNESLQYFMNENDLWQPSVKVTYSFDENRLINLLDFRPDNLNNWVQFYKYDYIYTEDQITEINRYSWDSDIWSPMETYTFDYNSNGCLSEYTNSYSSVTYEYEEGKGNAKFFYYYPEDLVDAEPTVKSAGTIKNKTYMPYYKRMLNMPQF